MTESNLATNTPAPCDYVVFTEFDGGEGVLVDLNTKKYYQLNETAMLVWRALEKRKSRGEITEEMIALYDVTAEHANSSVERLLQKFMSYKLVRSS